jgi:hypothetical protein
MSNYNNGPRRLGYDALGFLVPPTVHMYLCNYLIQDRYNQHYRYIDLRYYFDQ